MSTQNEYSRKVVLITGASSGFGKGVALQLAQRGAYVVLASRSPEVLNELADEMAHDTEFFEHAGNYTGRAAVPIPPTYDPQVTIDAMVKLVVEPQDESITGWQGGIFNALHKLMPAAIEKLMAVNTESIQMTSSEAAPVSSGTIHQSK